MSIGTHVTFSCIANGRIGNDEKMEDRTKVHMNDIELSSQKYLNHIIMCLSWLMYKVKLSNSVCFYDVNHACENVYGDILNALMNWDLKNLNASKINAEAIDLVDNNKQVVVQVSSRRDIGKVRSALSDLAAQKEYQGYTFYYLSITEDPPAWKKGDFSISPEIKFDPVENVFGVPALIKKCNGSDVDVQQRVYNACRLHFITNVCLKDDLMSSAKLTNEDMRLFINGFAQVYFEVEISLDTCRGYLDGNLLECGLPTINAHLGTHLNRKSFASLEYADEFRRRSMDFPELWEKIMEIQSCQQQLDCLHVATDRDVEIASSLLEKTKLLIEEAASAIAGMCPNAKVFECEFNQAGE